MYTLDIVSVHSFLIASLPRPTCRNSSLTHDAFCKGYTPVWKPANSSIWGQVGRKGLSKVLCIPHFPFLTVTPFQNCLHFGGNEDSLPRMQFDRLPSALQGHQ